MKKILLIISVLGATAILSQAADGKTLYAENCAKCHGASGKGDTRMGQKLGVQDYTSAKVQASFTDEQAAKDIKEGVTKDGKRKMKAFGDKLSDEQIKDLVAYIRSLKK